MKNQTEILKLKNTIREMMKATESIGKRADQVKERITDLENRNI